MNDTFWVKHLYVDGVKPFGVLISPALWEKLLPYAKEQELNFETSKPVDLPEPWADLELLKRFWDFKYPLSFSIECPHCGMFSDNWVEDSPRKFLLKAANLAGLLSLQCEGCGSRINKRHFKDKVSVDCVPKK